MPDKIGGPSRANYDPGFVKGFKNKNKISESDAKVRGAGKIIQSQGPIVNPVDKKGNQEPKFIKPGEGQDNEMGKKAIHGQEREKRDNREKQDDT